MPHHGKFQKILVTGGAGFIGSHIIDKLLEEDFVVVAYDNLSTGILTNIDRHMSNKNFSFVNGDIRDIDLVKTALKDVDVVFHEAALASVTRSVKDPILTNRVNVEGTLNVLKASCDIAVKRFIFASSAAIYGETASPEKKENDRLNPPSPYGVSKLAAEKYVQIFQKLYGLETICLRYFNVYGPRQRVDVHGSYGGVISIFISRLMDNMPPTINGDGEQTRDFVYINDVVEANILAMNSKTGFGEAFNVATGKNISINQIADILKGLMNKENLGNIHNAPRPTDVKHGYANIDKAKEILGYRPRCSIRDGLSKLVDWYTKPER
jgi:nucleoside-diphosphate-sugar epimerase